MRRVKFKENAGGARPVCSAVSPNNGTDSPNGGCTPLSFAQAFSRLLSLFIPANELGRSGHCRPSKIFGRYGETVGFGGPEHQSPSRGDRSPAQQPSGGHARGGVFQDNIAL